jgi:hypothetical protein
VTSAPGSGRWKVGPWRRRGDAGRYNPAMTTLMIAALSPVTAAPVHLSAEFPIGLPSGLTEVDAARIAAAISAARTESTRTVYAHAWRQRQRQREHWCAARGLAPLPGDRWRCAPP